MLLIPILILMLCQPVLPAATSSEPARSDKSIYRTLSFEKALKKVEKKCNPYGMYVIGARYLKEKKSPEQAFEWFKKSAQAGYIQAFYRVGICYLDAVGCKQSDTFASIYLKKAALLNDINANFALGMMYLEWAERCANDPSSKHSFDPESFKLAIQCFNETGGDFIRFAARNGHMIAQRVMGRLYLSGVGMDGDIVMGAGYLLLAAKQQDQLALEAVQSIFQTYPILKQILKIDALYNFLGVLRGDEESIYSLGCMYADLAKHVGNVSDKIFYTKKSAECILYAAERSHVLGQRVMGNYYYYGIGVEKNLPMAVSYLLLAAKQKDQPSMRMIAELCQTNPEIKAMLK